MRARDQSSIFSTGGKFRPDYGLLLELHALTLVARSYALLMGHYTFSSVFAISGCERIRTNQIAEVFEFYSLTGS